MSNPIRTETPLCHFAINADDTARAQRFYETVFGWRFNAWGPPGFWMIDTGTTEPAAPRGALQQRRTLIDGERMNGFECTIAVSELHAVERTIVAQGGTLLMPRTTIPSVGYLLFFRDTEGNVAGAMQYDTNARLED